MITALGPRHPILDRKVVRRANDNSPSGVVVRAATLPADRTAGRGRIPPGRPPHPSATANLLGVAAHRAIVLDGWQHLNAREPRDASSQAMSL